MNLNARMLKISLMIGAAITVFGNACGTGFETVAKQSAVARSSVARSAAGTSSTSATSGSGSSSTSSSSSSSSQGSSEVPVKKVIRTLKIKSLCTNSNQYALPTARQAVDLEARVFDQASKQVLCRIAGIKDQIVNQRQVTLPDSCKLPNGSYVLRIAAPGAPAGQSFAETLVDPSDALQFAFQNGDSGMSAGIPIKAIDGNVFPSNLRTDQSPFVYLHNTWTPPPVTYSQYVDPGSGGGGGGGDGGAGGGGDGGGGEAIARDGARPHFFHVIGAEPTPVPMPTAAPECERNENPPPPPAPVDAGGYSGGDGGGGSGGDGGDGAAAPVVKGK